tara:strand:+ start:871 stop:1428 length:558 start_codon:yes stop_codon:yes gene_type:complete
MSLSLFIIVLGGRGLKSNIEQHDVRWVIGKSIEDTFPELRKQWLGIKNGLHIDSYKCIKYIDGYRIDIVEKNTDYSTEHYSEDQSLWFINLGGYDENKMYEVHEFSLVVAKKAIEAKRKAKNKWQSNLKSKHNDDYSGINNIKKIDDIHSIKRIKQWEIKLIADKEKRSQELIPDWFGYMRIDKF